MKKTRYTVSYLCGATVSIWAAQASVYKYKILLKFNMSYLIDVVGVFVVLHNRQIPFIIKHNKRKIGIKSILNSQLPLTQLLPVDIHSLLNALNNKHTIYEQTQLKMQPNRPFHFMDQKMQLP